MGGKSTVTLSIEGMTCGACVASITSSLEGMNGIESASVSLITERAVVIFDKLVTDDKSIKEKIEDCGFDAKILDVEEDSEDSHNTDFSPNGESSQALLNSSDNSESLGRERGALTPTVAATEHVKLKVFGMTCSACSSSIENALSQVNGVKSATVSLTTEEARIAYDPNIVLGPRVLISAIEDIGFDAILAQSADNTSQIQALARVKEIKQYFRHTIICVCLSIPVVIITKLVPNTLPFLAFLKTPVTPHLALYWDDLINFILTFYIQFGIGKKFYKHAYKAMKNGAPNMDVLVAMSTTCSYVFSLISCIYALVTRSDKHPATLWETSAMIFTFVVFGKYLESRAKGQTSVALSRLISLVPSSAVIYEEPEQYYKSLKQMEGTPTVLLREKHISTDLLQPGDVVIIKPGEMVPADGIVLTGSSYISEALITGESYPVLKGVGNPVIGGSVNGRGKLECKVTRAGQNTKLSQIVRLVQDAQINKAPVQRYADWAAGYFVPTVLILALSTFAVWMIIAHLFESIRPAVFNSEEGPFMVCLRLCISVIVIACPCALGLATPTAVMVATGVGAEHGILIKGGSALEVGNKIDTVLFDKTGTLTYGRMSVSSCQIVGETLSEHLFWLIVGSAEQGSEHPIAKSLLYHAKRVCGLDEDVSFNSIVEDFTAFVGEGVRATVKLNSDVSHDVIIGSAAMLSRLNIEGVPGIHSDKNQPSDDLVIDEICDTLALVAIDGQYAGLVQLSDPIKPEAAEAVSALKALGFEVGMVSGDNSQVAAKVGEAVGISPSLIFSGVSPAGKIEIIRRLQGDLIEGDEFEADPNTESYKLLSASSSRRYIAMVGDGINDSPALASASLGIAMVGATDVAIEAADVVLLRENALLDIAAAFDLSRRAYSRIKFNLVAALIYNVVMIPFAMGIFLPFGMMISPMMASAAMAMSSVSVLLSSLLLQTWRPPKWISNGSQEVVYGQMQEMGIETGDAQSHRSWFSRLFHKSSKTSREYSALRDM
ncbi:Cu(2+)-transporting P-type ATPase CCC2 [Sugiyamaella lignohabitans]|uniref:P-type Cu(+) transporter n=1 Tax=Sugiyamaella lignohabitans TaxID=796027 RepID=A0A167FGR1_9ASCO|nr:Cu(2+)-transporting P-type ATPase CCC2 [Sugiyamaella lignohabitans]ANB15279.1 Cu(2+)-transporting P-type ATPase CCC2 [Sugiyamaella lignohabitans]